MTQTFNSVAFSPLSGVKNGAKKEIETSLISPSENELSHFENNKDCGIFRILDQAEGDKRLVWNRMSLADISEAHRMFNSFLAEGLEAYRVDPNGKQGGRMEKFDPTAEEIILLPMKMVAGG